MSSLWAIEILVFIALGVTSHVTLFIRGELNQYAAKIVLWLAIALIVLLFLAIVQELSFLRGLNLAILLFLAYQSALATSILVYRVYFHRACQFPGPTLDSISKWTAAKRSKKRGQYHLELVDLHAKYGDIVRTGPMELSINSSEALNAVHRANICTKGPWYDLGGIGQNLHRTRSRELHILQRPFWEKGLSKKALNDYMDPIETEVTALFDQIEVSRNVVDINAKFQVFAFKVMSKLTFSTADIPTGGNEGVRKMLAMLDRSQTLLSTFGHVPWLYAIAKYIPGLLRSNAQFSDLANVFVERRREINPQIPDLFSYLLKTENNPNAAGFPLSWEARLAIVVGRQVHLPFSQRLFGNLRYISVNTSAALTAICFYLATSPMTLHNLQAEVSPLFNAGTFDMRKPLPVLDSIITESLRLQALIPSGQERKTPPSGLPIGNGVFLPGNLVVRVPNFAICRDERYFVHAHDFIPERWTTREDLVIDASVMQPFGSGVYSCVGKELGMMEIRAVVARLAVEYTWRVDECVDVEAWEFSGKDHFAMVFGELQVVFEKRRKG